MEVQMRLSGKMLDAFTWHATYRDMPGASLFTARLAAALIELLDDTTELGNRILGWVGNPTDDAVPLRAFAAFHALSRSGAIPELTAVYPPAEASDDQLTAALQTAISHSDSFLATYLDSPPQTNEAGRSAIILGAALHLAQRFGLPIELYEIGSSAGLNLRLADYGYDFGNGRTWRPNNPPLVIHSDWRGSHPPLDIPLRITGAAGCDVAPLDPSAGPDAARLMSYVWADMTERLERMAAAIRNARRDTIRVERADAAEWVESRFAAPPQQGRARLLFHTFVWSYLPQSTRDRITTALERAGTLASNESPLAWLSVENDEQDTRSARIDLRIWPGGEMRTLGRAQFHGKWVEWA